LFYNNELDSVNKSDAKTIEMMKVNNSLVFHKLIKIDEALKSPMLN